MPQHLPALVTLLAVCLQLGVMFNVGRARGKYKVQAPATIGPPEFERALRIQANTVESTLMFLPALWMSATYFSPFWAGILGTIWLVGRVAYCVGYQRAAEKRSAGFLIGFLAIMALLITGLIGVVQALTTVN